MCTFAWMQFSLSNLPTSSGYGSKLMILNAKHFADAMFFAFPNKLNNANQDAWAAAELRCDVRSFLQFTSGCHVCSDFSSERPCCEISPNCESLSSKCEWVVCWIVDEYETVCVSVC